MSTNATVGFVPDSGGRGTVSLLWNCLSTWFICLWVIFHVNIPAPGDSKFLRTLRQAAFMIVGATIPEYIVAIAHTQRQNAIELLIRMQQLHRSFYLPLPQITSIEIGKESQRNIIKAFRNTAIENWTITHSFYCVMGGFHITPPESTTSFPVNSEQLLWLLRNGYVEMPSISLEELKDKSKSDSLLKSIAIFQAFWFVIQRIGRAAQDLPTTTLEITTIAYVLCMIPCQLLWWSKLYNVTIGTPLRIVFWPQGTRERLQALSLKYRYIFEKRCLVEYPRMLNFIEVQTDEWKDSWRNVPDWVVLIAIAFIFAVTHCIAWNFHFPSTTERFLWMFSTCSILGVAFSLPLELGFLKYSLISENTLRNFVLIEIAIYVAARTFLMVEVFTALRSVPKDVYDTVNWGKYLPVIA